MAEEQGLELVEVNPRAAPPVCKIMDFGKFKYETSKKEKASRKHQSTIVLKEIKLRPKTDDHDFDFKVKHIRRFLSEGNKCKLVVVFRGREIVHPEMGQADAGSGREGGERHRHGRAAGDDGRASHGHDHRPARRRDPRRRLGARWQPGRRRQARTAFGRAASVAPAPRQGAAPAAPAPPARSLRGRGGSAPDAGPRARRWRGVRVPPMPPTAPTAVRQAGAGTGEAARQVITASAGGARRRLAERPALLVEMLA